jgi:hypothetical protein
MEKELFQYYNKCTSEKNTSTEIINISNVRNATTLIILRLVNEGTFTYYQKCNENLVQVNF